VSAKSTKEIRKANKQTGKQRANNKNHEKNKPKMLHSIAGQKVFYFHTFVGQNPRTITEIFVFFLYIYIQCDIKKRAKCWENCGRSWPRNKCNGSGWSLWGI